MPLSHHEINCESKNELREGGLTSLAAVFTPADAARILDGQQLLVPAHLPNLVAESASARALEWALQDILLNGRQLQLDLSDGTITKPGPIAIQCIEAGSPLSYKVDSQGAVAIASLAGEIWLDQPDEGCLLEPGDVVYTTANDYTLTAWAGRAATALIVEGKIKSAVLYS